MLGCEKPAAIRVSRRKRSRRSDWAANSGGSTLSATGRSRARSRASSTRAHATASELADDLVAIAQPLAQVVDQGVGNGAVGQTRSMKETG
jgi:hypothetical protein